MQGGRPATRRGNLIIPKRPPPPPSGPGQHRCINTSRQSAEPKLRRKRRQPRGETSVFVLSYNQQRSLNILPPRLSGEEGKDGHRAGGHHGCAGGFVLSADKRK